MDGKHENENSKNCAICRYEITDEALVKNCLHSFCFGCLKRWILQRNPPTCPLCIQPIISIIHHVRSDDDYDLLIVQQPEPNVLSDEDRDGASASHMSDDASASCITFYDASVSQMPDEAPESPMLDDASDSDRSDNSSESHTSDDASESHMSDDASESHMPDDASESHMSDDVSESHSSDGASESHTSDDTSALHVSDEDHSNDPYADFRNFYTVHDGDHDDMEVDDSDAEISNSWLCGYLPNDRR